MDAGFLTHKDIDASSSDFDASAQLAKRAATGDRAAFSQLVAAEYDFIFKVAFKWSGAQSDAEDVAQDVCIKLARILDQFEGRSKFRSWLYRIIVNTVRDKQRKQGRRAEVSDDRVAEIAGETQTDADLERNAIWHSVRQLPPRQADAVLLVYAQEKTHAQAASILGCKESTVSWHIHEAKKALKDIL